MSRDTGLFGLKIPFIQMLGARAEHWEKGRAIMTLEVRPEHTNSWGYAHGGLLMSLLDVTMGGAARSLDPEARVMTVDMNTSFIRSGIGHLTVEGRVLDSGSTLVFCEGEVRDAAAYLVAKGSGTFRMRRKKEGK